MQQWAMEHPWMTFFIVITLLTSITISVSCHVRVDKRNDG